MKNAAACQPLSWGRLPVLRHQGVQELLFRSDPLPEPDSSMLPFGNGRSYGDSCQNEDGLLLATRRLDRFIEFDSKSGRFRCESGTMLRDILAIVVKRGWFLPVTPGTQLITVGGAIANDVHGKNHHVAGSFGNHLLRFELLRSDGTRLVCSQGSNQEIFHATIGGLGLTGLITWAEFQLKPVSSPFITSETICFSHLREFFELAEESNREFEYTVAWVDCFAAGKKLGRGVLFRGNHEKSATGAHAGKARHWTLPIDSPVPLLGNRLVRSFNGAFFKKHQRTQGVRTQHYGAFHYPLDGIRHWNRAYGSKGFYQFQSVVPNESASETVQDMLKLIASSGQGSFLSVLKRFGDIPSLGLLSFPRPGITFALDFPNKGEKTRALLNELEMLVADAGGAIYPAKDARMSAGAFATGFPGAAKFAHFVDPRFSSSFWRRVWP